MNEHSAYTSPLDLNFAWLAVREVAKRARARGLLNDRIGFAWDVSGRMREAPLEQAQLWIDPQVEPHFGARVGLAPEVASLLSLYLPLCLAARSAELVILHLGQSLDGQIATASGESRYVTSSENLTHVHRLRALCDAVVVGASTVERDDPKLTTRLVTGENPVRVVIDPALRTSSARLWSDQAARSLLICARGATGAGRLPASVEVIELPDSGRRLDPARIVAELKTRGLSRLLVEGGGVTVSRFLQARAAHRLHLCVSPLLLGSGRPGLALPPVESLARAMRPKVRRFELGPDLLFDCELEAPGMG
jgi:diaminohydroxyphosphoribosylaminopyrimidine deaminase / 5-amino-6-(5-phosphoribosylamino)uracil reductase